MKGFLKSFLFFTFCTLTALWSGAQTFFKTASFGAAGHYGSFLTTAPKAQYVKDSYSFFGEAYFQKTTIEGQPWGAGFFYGNTGSRQYIGNMGGVFTYVQLPLFRTPHYTSNLRLAGGAGWIQKPYNKDNNYKNLVIGSHLNGYINLAWQNEIKILKTLSAIAGVSFTHLSNGASTLPNMGLNIPAFTFGLRYAPSYPADSVFYKNPQQQNGFYYHLSTSAGIKQIPWIGSKRYLINVVSAEAKKDWKTYNALGAGVLFFYNQSLEVNPATITSDKRNISKIQAAVYGVYERKMGRITIPLHLGAMVYNKDINPVLFQQVGVRYNATGNWWTQIQLKSYGGRADLLHAGVGYNIQ